MKFREVDLGFNWSLHSGSGPESIYLPGQYQIDPSDLQTRWDNRLTEPVNGVPVTTFNYGQEKRLVHFTGWGVDTKRKGSGTDATLIAAANPDHQVDVVDSSVGLSSDEMSRLHETGDWKSFVSRFTRAIESQDDDVRLTGIHGHSLGAIVATNLLRCDLPSWPDVVTLHDAPRMQTDKNPLLFGLKIGGVDNALDYPENPEQKVLEALEIGEPNKGLGTALNLAKEQWELIRAMSQTGLENEIHEAIAKNVITSFYLFHGIYNRGLDVEGTRNAVESLMYRNSYAKKRLAYYEGDSGHYFSGQSARIARLIKWANSQVL